MTGLDNETVLYNRSKPAGVLTEPYTNFKYLIIIGVVNIDLISIIIPTKSISSSKNCMLHGASNNATGLISEFNYRTSLFVKFPTTTTFTQANMYTNQNYSLIVDEIIGIHKPLLSI